MFMCTYVYIDDGLGLGRKIQAVCLLLLAIYMLPKMKLFFSKKNFFYNVNRLLILYCLALVISSYMAHNSNLVNLTAGYGYEWINNEFESSSWTLSVYFSSSILFSFAYVEDVCHRNKTVAFVKSLERVILLYLVLYDVSFFFDFIYSFDLGNKFVSAYMHMVYLCVLLLHNKLTGHDTWDRYLFPITIFSMVMALLLNCATGFVAIFLFLLFVWRTGVNHRYNSFYSIKLISAVLLLCSSFAYLYIFIIDSPLLLHILETIGKSDTFASRLEIFNVALPLLFINGIWGVGAGNSTKFFRYLFDYPNAQNGLIDIIITDGIISVSLMILLFFYLIRKNKLYNNTYTTFPVAIMLFIYICVSCVEVTLGYNFTCMFPLLLLGLKNKRYIRV